MSLKRYESELIVIVSFVLLCFVYLYKQHQQNSVLSQTVMMQQKVDEVKRAVALKKLWGNPSLSTKVDKLKSVIPSDRVKWDKQSKKLKSRYENMTAAELNKLGKILLNLGIQIDLFTIEKKGSSYNVELTCRW